MSKFSSRSFDWALFVVTLFLCLLGMSSIYSIDLSRGLEIVYFKKQLIAFIIGILLLFFASIMQPSFYRRIAKPVYFGSLLLLLAVLFFGATIRGTRGWFVFGGFSFQPVEAVKVAVVLILAYSISNFGRRFERLLFFLGTGVLVLAPILLVMKQPDLGSAVILGSTWLGLVFLVGARKLHILSLMLAMILLAVAAWMFWLAPYQKDRVLTFIDPERDQLGAGYNTTQSIIAVGSGQIFGRGLGFGSQSQLRFLPESQTDFIFSVIAEELGFAGVIVLLILFTIMFWRFFVLIQRSNDDFSSLVLSGILLIFVIQMIINIGANIGLLPVTGVTLPFVSYGGSSLIINLGLIGIAQSMVVRRY